MHPYLDSVEGYQTDFLPYKKGFARHLNIHSIRDLNIHSLPQIMRTHLHMVTDSIILVVFERISVIASCRMIQTPRCQADIFLYFATAPSVPVLTSSGEAFAFSIFHCFEWI